MSAPTLSGTLKKRSEWSRSWNPRQVRLELSSVAGPPQLRWEGGATPGVVTLDEGCTAHLAGSELALRSATREIRFRSGGSPPTVQDWLAAIQHSQALAAKHSQALAALGALDEPLVAPLQRGDILLLRASWLKEQPADWRLVRRQELEQRHGQAPFLPTGEAAALIRRGRRETAVVSHGVCSPPRPDPANRGSTPLHHPVAGWLEPGCPDQLGTRLALLRAFLTAHPEIIAVFFDYSSLFQPPRSGEEYAAFKRALSVMASLCARPHAPRSPHAHSASPTP